MATEDFEGDLTLPDDGTAQRMLSETNRACATLKADAKAWEEERDDRGLWDVTLSDGLESGTEDS